jgi:hypothetical protein
MTFTYLFTKKKYEMPTARITLAYKQLIDATATGIFEQRVLHASYQEFLLKSQAYNPEKKFSTFSELRANDGRANSLHYKTGFAADGFISTLNNQIPNLKTTLGKSVRFSTYQFEVIESDITNKAKHAVAITYFTGPVLLHAVIGNYLLLSNDDDCSRNSQVASETYLITLQHFLSISSHAEVFVNPPFLNPS